MYKTQRKTLYLLLFVMSILLTACSSDSGSDDGSTKKDTITPEPVQSSEWDKMEWDKGQWK